MAENQPNTRFVNVQDFPGYRVGTDGSVWSRWQLRGAGKTRRCVLEDVWRHLRTDMNKRTDHLRVSLFRDGKSYKRWIHHLVLVAFEGPRPSGLECRHINGSPADNHLGNLKWGTKKENAADRKLHGTEQQGEIHYNSILSEIEVKEMREMHRQGSKVAHIARHFGRRWDTTWRAMHTSWQHIT